QCDCGNEKITSTSLLNAGKVRSCGCLRQEVGYKRRNLEGKRYGRLTVISMTDKRDYKGSIIWKVRCDCGNIIEASEDNLVHGHHQSCGCKRIEQGKNLGQFLTFVNGTCIEWLENRKHRSDNTSGYQGGYQKKNGKYAAGISLCGKRYYIGTYADFEGAVNARKKAEKYLHEGFIKAYHEWELELVSKSLSAEEYPFEFEVDKRFWNEL
ncbi:MAG: hypothetical protein KBT48_12000, partial [Firmicutes bacterium]|nr:hypothetical protein [Bacillota bacterium]